MIHDVEFSTLLVYALFLTARANYDPNMDNILFSVNWPGPAPLKSPVGDHLAEENTMFMTTAQNEKYKCSIPSFLETGHQGDDQIYSGPSEYQLLKPLLDQTSCSYRIETYWTYELCHGKHLRQYHEEKELNKKPKLQEYFLGRLNREAYEAAHVPEPTEKVEEDSVGQDSTIKIPLQKVLGLEIPYFAINYTDGTKCDLTGHPRQASIRYVCQEEGKGEIYELKEMSTCEYEVVILTSQLCAHPSYGPKKDPVNRIQCQALDGTPKKPKSLEDLEIESAQGRFNRKDLWEKGGDTFDPDNGIVKNLGWDISGHAKIRKGKRQEQLKKPWWEEDEEELNDDLEDENDERPKIKPDIPKKDTVIYQEKERPPSVIDSSTDKQLLNEFLRGEYCIQGGTGWWKHEFCYGKKVIQFHEDKQSGKTVVILGRWDEETHKNWLSKNPTKKPKPTAERKSISQFYGLGELCDLTKRHRFVEVKLKCKENSSQPHAVAIYLVEPATCEYVLVVESPILCDIIEKADEFGMVPAP